MRTALLPLLLALVACGGNPQKQLDDARAQWVEDGSEAYAMTVSRTQLGAGTDSYQVTVLAGGVTTATRTTGGENTVLEAASYLPWFTVPGVFDEIQAGIDAGAFDVIVTYDPDTGYPVEATIDQDQLSAEDDVTFAITAMVLNENG